MSNEPNKCISVLYIDDGSSQSDDARYHLLADAQFRIFGARSFEEVDRLLTQESIDVVVSGIKPLGSAELQILDKVRVAKAILPVVILATGGSERCAVEAMKRGAADYIPTSPGYLDQLSSRLVAAIRRSAHHFALDGIEGLAGERSIHSPVLDALSVNVALVDQQGVICAVNEAWKEFARENQGEKYEEGHNYLEICERAAEQEVPGAADLARGLRQVLAEECFMFSTEYVYPSPTKPRWFTVLISPLRDSDRPGAMIVHVDVTNRKLAVAERDRLFDQSLNLVAVIGFDGYVKRWNQAWTQLLGDTFDEIQGAPLREWLHPDDQLIQAENWQRLLKEGVAGGEVRLRCKDGSYRWILWNGMTSLEQQEFFIVGQDVTARKQAEQELRENQERFELLASATNDAIWDWDLRENRVWCNECYRQAFGDLINSEKTPFEWWQERIHPDDKQRILSSFPLPIVEGRRQWSWEYRHRRIDGSYSYVFDRGFVILDEHGNPVRMVGSLMDISALKNAEEKLRESEERFRLVAKTSHDAIWDWDMRMAQVWRSEGFQTLFGYKPEEVSSDWEWWSERIHPDDRERVFAQIPMPGGPDFQQSKFEYRFRRADGSYVDLLDRGFVMFNAEGKPVRMIGTMTDISQRRRAEEAAHIHRAELAHIARLRTMGEIATGLAHELNQPLTAIANYAHCSVQAILSKSQDRDQDLLTWIEHITTNTHRAAEMIRRMRGFIQKSVPCREVSEVNELIQEVLDLLEAETRIQNVRIEWSPSQPIHANVDRIQIQQVLINLLYNAYEAMAANPTENRRVTINTLVKRDKIDISVKDQGEGIAPENMDNVFKAFFTSKPNGLGVGLAISRSIVEAHDGRMRVESNADRGVTFHLTLPLAGAQNA